VNAFDLIIVCVVRMREEQHQQVMRRRQEMEREAAATVMSKKTVDGGGGSTQRLDEPMTAGRMTTRQITADDRTGSKTELADKQKLRSVIEHLQPLYLLKWAYRTALLFVVVR